MACFRTSLETMIPRQAGEKRDAWFYRCARALGMEASRMKSLFYYPTRTKMWAKELETIQERQGVLIQRQINVLKQRQAVLSARLESINGVTDVQISSHGRGARSGRRGMAAAGSRARSDGLR